MEKSKVEQEFINWCQMLHPDINPYIFIHRHIRYFEEYLPLLDDTMKKMYNFIHAKNPNTHFILKGRIKNKRGYLIKSFITLSNNIDKIFNHENDEQEREKEFEKYFKFLKIEKPEKYNELKEFTQTIISSFDYLDSFLIIFNKLSKDEKDKFIYRLGRTEDTFAYRLIVDSVDFPIQSVDFDASHNSFYITDQNGKKVPIHAASTLDPKKDIIHSEKNDKNYIYIHKKREILNERNLLYPNHIPSKERNLPNAQKDENGNLTLLRDSIISINGNSHLNILDIHFNPKNNSVFVTNSEGEVRNLSSLLQKDNFVLRKHDEDSLIQAVYKTNLARKEFYENNNIQSIKSRYKDYIKSPKPETEYMSIHDSAIDKKHGGYAIEAQSRTLEMEDSCKDETTRVGHDVYKKEKERKYSQNKILARILATDPTAFDTSSSTLMKILEDDNVELSEILGKYILVTLIDGKVESFQPTIDMVFEHTFHTQKISEKDSHDDEVPKLDFSSYKNFITSRNLRNIILKKEADFPDIYDEEQ